MDLAIPPPFQLLAALVIGVLVAVGAAYKFFTELRGGGEKSRVDLLGVALGDSMALKNIVDELRDIRVVMERHIDRDKTEELAAAVKALTVALRAKSRGDR